MMDIVCLAVDDAPSVDRSEVDRGRWDAYRIRPLVPLQERSATGSLPVAKAPTVPEPGLVSDFHIPPPALSFDKEIPSDVGLVDGIVAEITAAIERTGCWQDSESIGLALEEALINAIVHGNHSLPEKAVFVSVIANAHCDLLITVRDSGPGFEISRLPDPTAAENQLADHGRGIFLMRQLMDRVDFRFDHGTEVQMRRQREKHRADYCVQAGGCLCHAFPIPTASA